jgi:hypothetical protein
MIVDYGYIVGVAVSPHEAYPQPIVNPYAVLAGPVASQGFQAIARRNTQIVQSDGGVQHHQFAIRYAQDIFRQPFGSQPMEHFLCLLAGERAYHI